MLIIMFDHMNNLTLHILHATSPRELNLVRALDKDTRVFFFAFSSSPLSYMYAGNLKLDPIGPTHPT